MKCPQCGQWNRASFTTCQKCGAPLPAADGEPAWRASLRDNQHGATYLRADLQTGQLDDNKPDSRDELAQEMSQLKVRKASGSSKQRTLRASGAEFGMAPSPQNHYSGKFVTSGAWNLGKTSTVRISRTTGTDEPDKEEAEDPSLPTYEADEQEDDFFDTARSYNPVWPDQEVSSSIQIPPITHDTQFTVKLPSSRRGRRFLIRGLLALVILVLAGSAGYFGYYYYESRKAAGQDQSSYAVTASIHNDLAAHTILIPGEEGSQIYIRELRTSYIVTNGFATIEIEDHTWYDDYEDFLQPTMEVTLTPFAKTASGQQRPLDPITYEIDIPPSPIELVTPDSQRTEVAATMYTMEFDVRPGSKVTINGDDYSDTVNSETGRLSYNATVQPIGDNVFNVVVRSQYCRESLMTVVLYREPQDIPLDLAADTYTSTSQSSMQVHMTTMPGAYIEVLSPHTDLDITKIDSTGEFSFYATWDHIGYNTITVTASAEGKATSTLSYNVYYVPPANVYTPRAWPMNENNYAELLSTNIRAQKTQVYVVMGTVSYFVSDKPQMAVIYTTEDGKSQPVLVENYTRTTWQQGQYYRIYADAYGTYDNMPWLCARYTYTY